jgi:transmembrane sensor
LNRGAVVTEHFTPTERRMRLVRGEANFKVARDATRPFLVEAAGVTVRAVGTVFNVRLDPRAVEVVVTEGKVAVVSPENTAPSTPDGPRAAMPEPQAGGAAPPAPEAAMLVSAGERTLVVLADAAPAPTVSVVSPEELETRLAWQPRMLDFTNAPLAEIAAEFNRRNPVRITPGDGGVGGLRLSATFRSDNVEGFIRLMESDFGLRAEWRGGSEVILSRAK